MIIRPALETEADAVVAMGRSNALETRNEIGFDEFTAYQTFYQYIDTASPTIYVAEARNREIVGFFLSDVCRYRWACGHYALQEVLYVKPEHRGGRVAVMLVKELIAWAKRMGAQEILGGNDNRFNGDRTARFLEHFEFERVGYHLRKDLTHGRR